MPLTDRETRKEKRKQKQDSNAYKNYNMKTTPNYIFFLFHHKGHDIRAGITTSMSLV